MKKLMPCIFNKKNRNLNSNATKDIDSTDESESDLDFSVTDSVFSDNESVAFEPFCQQSKIKSIQINTSTDVHIGNKIFYQEPVIIQQPMLHQNRFNLEAAGDNVNQIANVLSRPGVYSFFFSNKLVIYLQKIDF